MDRRTLIAWLLLATFAALPGLAPAQEVVPQTHVLPPLKEYETRYYRVFTDVDPLEAREACIRMTRMAEEYHDRTADFTGQITAKLPFYLFKSDAEYYAAGGLRNSAGVFNGIRLMAIGDKRYGWQVWHVVQHEGFHQFVRAVIGGSIPIWVNEGMAEYFGEAIFTGDGFISGVVPSARLQRIRKTIALGDATGGFKHLRQIMRESNAQWISEMSLQNYDQAWSMVQFLAHGDGGKYQQAFGRYMVMVGSGQDPNDAWNSNFGDDTEAFESRWRAFWTTLPDHPTPELYARAVVAMFTSFLARAADQHQRFDSFDQFIDAAQSGELKCSDDEWLPPSLLQAALRDLSVRRVKGDKFTLSSPGGSRLQTINCVTAGGIHVVGKFELEEGKVSKVTAELISPKRVAD